MELKLIAVAITLAVLPRFVALGQLRALAVVVGLWLLAATYYWRAPPRAPKPPAPAPQRAAPPAATGKLGAGFRHARWGQPYRGNAADDSPDAKLTEPAEDGTTVNRWTMEFKNAVRLPQLCGRACRRHCCYLRCLWWFPRVP